MSKRRPQTVESKTDSGLKRTSFSQSIAAMFPSLSKAVAAIIPLLDMKGEAALKKAESALPDDLLREADKDLIVFKKTIGSPYDGSYNLEDEAALRTLENMFPLGRKLDLIAARKNAAESEAARPDSKGFKSAAEIAEILGRDKEACRKALERARLGIGEKPQNREWVEFPDRKKNEDKYIYNTEWAKKVLT